MTSLQQRSPEAEPEVATLARRSTGLLDTRVDAMTVIRGGGNNRLYRLDLADGRRVALKAYPKVGAGIRDRLAAEYGALKFLTREAPGWVPRPLAVDSASDLAIYEWIDGEPVASPTDADCERAIAFARVLRMVSQRPGADALPEAAEPILRLSDGIEQIESRLIRFAAIGREDHDLGHFIEVEFRPVLGEVRKRAIAAYQRIGLAPEAPVAIDRRTLSPSDFGFHNAIRRTDGQLVFLDLEYFGWDDPAKLVADFLQHPGMSLDAHRRQLLSDGFHDVFGADATFGPRLAVLAPLIGTRWCLILLNEFLPERWQRRRLAGQTHDHEAAKSRQLEKARARLRIVRRFMEKGGSWH